MVLRDLYRSSNGAACLPCLPLLACLLACHDKSTTNPLPCLPCHTFRVAGSRQARVLGLVDGFIYCGKKLLMASRKNQDAMWLELVDRLSFIPGPQTTHADRRDTRTALKIKCGIPERRDWSERALHVAFLKLCELEPRLLALARLIERDKRPCWFGSYRAPARRFAAPLNRKLPAFCQGHACDIAEDFLYKLLIQHRAQRTLRLPPPMTELDRRALTCRLPEPEVLPPYEHTVAQLASI